MNKKQIDKKDFMPLDSYESSLMQNIENDVLIPTKDLDNTKEFFAEAVKNYKNMQGSKRITIRINNADLIKLKAKAKQEGMPYQTFLGSILHRYVIG